MSLQTPQVTTTLTHDDLEALIRRVIREELSRILPATPAEPAHNGNGEAELIEKDGFLLAKTDWKGDIVELIRQEREARLDAIMQEVGA